jgi:hypothetical protein
VYCRPDEGLRHIHHTPAIHPSPSLCLLATPALVRLPFLFIFATLLLPRKSKTMFLYKGPLVIHVCYFAPDSFFISRFFLTVCGSYKSYTVLAVPSDKGKYGVRSPKFSLAETPQKGRNPPPIPPHLGSYTRALLVSQIRRHLFVTPCCQLISRDP